MSAVSPPPAADHAPATATLPPPWLRRIPAVFRPPFETARHYSHAKFRKDLVAGLTVSVVELPQSMAYALIAGVPPQYGVYTSIIQGIIGALLSSSEHMTTGPTNTQSLLIAAAVHRVVSPGDDPQRYLHLVFCLAALKGLIQLAFAALNLGDLVRYVSRSVISGLVSGAGFLIFFGQLPSLLGVRTHDAHEPPGVVAPLSRVFNHAGEISARSLALGLGVAAFVLVGRRISRFFPGALVGVAIATTIVALAGWTDAQLPLIGQLPSGLPHPVLPLAPARDLLALLGGAAALAVIGMIEAVAIAKSIAVRTGETIVPNQEFFSQGFKNFVSSFWQCIPGSGSFTRSALDYAAGAETRFAAVFNALSVASLFFLFSVFTRHLPYAALSGVLLVIAVGLVEWTYLLNTWRVARPDALVWLVTFFSTLFAPLEYAVFIGVAANLLLHLHASSRLRLSTLETDPASDDFIERDLASPRRPMGPIAVLNVDGPLFFGVAGDLLDRLQDVSRDDRVRVLILRLRRARSPDATVLSDLARFAQTYQASGRHLLICGISPALVRQLATAGLAQTLGPDHLFPAQPVPFTSLKQALARARQLTAPASPPPTSPITYEI